MWAPIRLGAYQRLERDMHAVPHATSHGPHRPSHRDVPAAVVRLAAARARRQAWTAARCHHVTRHHVTPDHVTRHYGAKDGAEEAMGGARHGTHHAIPRHAAEVLVAAQGSHSARPLSTAVEHPSHCARVHCSLHCSRARFSLWRAHRIRALFSLWRVHCIRALFSLWRAHCSRARFSLCAGAHTA
jgi:hypothetical protein